MKKQSKASYKIDKNELKMLRAKIQRTTDILDAIEAGKSKPEIVALTNADYTLVNYYFRQLVIK